MSMRVPGNIPITSFGAVTPNPASGAMLVDSGALAYDGIFEVRVIAGGDVASSLRVEHRNVTNVSNLDVLPFYTAAGQTSQLVYSCILAKGERLRVAVVATVTGNLSATLQLEHLA